MEKNNEELNFKINNKIIKIYCYNQRLLFIVLTLFFK